MGFKNGNYHAEISIEKNGRVRKKKGRFTVGFLPSSRQEGPAWKGGGGNKGRVKPYIMKSIRK